MNGFYYNTAGKAASEAFPPSSFVRRKTRLNCANMILMSIRSFVKEEDARGATYILSRAVKDPRRDRRGAKKRARGAQVSRTIPSAD